MFSIGHFHESTRTISSADVSAFAALSGDHNPIHLDAEFAAETQFKQPIVHGAFLASLISASLAEHLPGRGTIYLGQTLAFRSPVYVGDTVSVKILITAIREDKPIFKLKTTVNGSSGVLAVDGEATVMFPQGAQASR